MKLFRGYAVINLGAVILQSHTKNAYLQRGMKLKNFSVGMRQKAGIIQAIMEKQELILLDEPTRGLDQESIHIFCQIINQLHQQGHTIMIAAHDYLPDIQYTHIYHLEGQLYLDEMD